MERQDYMHIHPASLFLPFMLQQLKKKKKKSGSAVDSVYICNWFAYNRPTCVSACISSVIQYMFIRVKNISNKSCREELNTFYANILSVRCAVFKIKQNWAKTPGLLHYAYISQFM